MLQDYLTGALLELQGFAVLGIGDVRVEGFLYPLSKEESGTFNNWKASE